MGEDGVCFQKHLIFHSEAEFVHVKVAEEGVLSEQVNLLHLVQVQDRQAMWRPVDSVAQEELLEVLI